MSEKKIASSSVKENLEDDINDRSESKLLASAQQNSNNATLLTEPSQGAALTQDYRWELFYDVYDSFLIAISIGLLVKTSLCVYAYNRDKYSRGLRLDAVSPLTIDLIRFNEQLVTAFTIIFVTIMTTVSKRYALYKAQKGAYIGDIEQLQASVSLPSTIKMVFSLQQFTKISILLVITWSFYYTGSQAAKREYALVFGNATQSLTAAYPQSQAAYVNFDTSTWPSGTIDNLLGLFSSTGGERPEMNSESYGVDKDGDMLLPIVHPDYVSQYSLNGFYANGTVNQTKFTKFRPSDTDYEQVGRPLLIAQNYTDTYDNVTYSYTQWGVERIIGKYQVQTSTIVVQCRSVELLPATQFPTGAIDTVPQAINITEVPGLNNSSSRQLQFWQRWGANQTIYDIPMPFINGTVPAALKFTCDLFEPQIDVHVTCSETACLAVKLNLPKLAPDVLNATIFSNATFSASFFDTMLLAGGVPSYRNQSAAVTSWLAPTLDGQALANGSITPAELDSYLADQSHYLETMINAYVNVIIKANYVTWTETFAATEYTDLMGPPPHVQYIKFKGAVWDKHYQLYWQWAAIDYVAGALLLVASVISFWLRKNTLAPDIFGFVSTLTRDNPNFPVPVGGSTLDGISRTRALRSLKVKIADVSDPQEGHGRLGFVPVIPTRPTEVLQKDRKYL